MSHELDEFERSLLRAGRRQRAPEGLRAKSLAAAAALSVAGAAVPTVSASSGGGSAMGGSLFAKAQLLGRLAAVKWAAVAVSVALVSAYVAVTHAPAPPVALPAEVVPVVPRAPVAHVVVAPVVEPEPPPVVLELPVTPPPAPARPKMATPPPPATVAAEDPRSAAPPPAPPAPAAPKVGLADEIRIVDAARAALSVQNPARTLDLVAEHEKKHPRGAFAAERDALRVDALMLEGRTGEASAAARSFVAAHPSSAQRARMRRIAAQPPFE